MACRVVLRTHPILLDPEDPSGPDPGPLLIPATPDASFRSGSTGGFRSGSEVSGPDPGKIRVLRAYFNVIFFSFNK